MSPKKRAQKVFTDPALAEARRRGWLRSLEVRANAPKCGAKSRQTGLPCKNPVKEEGKRCRYHGGATPKGKDWHRRQFPSSPHRLEGKMKALRRRDREAEERRAAMTPEEREKHEERRRHRQPGTPLERRKAKYDREARKMVSALLDNPDKRRSDEEKALAAEIELLEAAAAELEKSKEDETEDDKGIFG